MSLFFSNLLGSRSRTSLDEGKVVLSLSDEEIASAGPLASSERAEFRIEGMTCGACVEVRCLDYDLGAIRHLLIILR
jgi:P-type Cu+ transporter